MNCVTNRVYVVDDDSEIRKSLHFMFSASSIVVWPFASALDFLAHLPHLSPAPILLDIQMPDIDGLQLLKILKDKGVIWPAVIMTAHGTIEVAVRAMKLGAVEFIEKPFEPESLEQAVSMAFGMLNRGEQGQLAYERAHYLFGQLTKREREVMAILVEGVPNKEAAYRLSLSVRTIEMHRGNALAKLNVRSLTEVVRIMNMGRINQNIRIAIS